MPGRGLRPDPGRQPDAVGSRAAPTPFLHWEGLARGWLMTLLGRPEPGRALARTSALGGQPRLLQVPRHADRDLPRDRRSGCGARGRGPRRRLSGIGEPDLPHRGSCSRWPEQRHCGQRCLSRRSRPLRPSAVRADDTRPVVPEINTAASAAIATSARSTGCNYKPALLTPNRKMVEWAEITPEMLPGGALETHQRVCWRCHVVEAVARAFPGFRGDRASSFTHLGCAGRKRKRPTRVAGRVECRPVRGHPVTPMRVLRGDLDFDGLGPRLFRLGQMHPKDAVLEVRRHFRLVRIREREAAEEVSVRPLDAVILLVLLFLLELALPWMVSTPFSTVTFTSSFFTSGRSAFTRYSFVRLLDVDHRSPTRQRSTSPSRWAGPAGRTGDSADRTSPPSHGRTEHWSVHIE